MLFYNIYIIMIYTGSSAEFHREGFDIRRLTPLHTVTKSCSDTFAPLRDCLNSKNALAINIDQSKKIAMQVDVTKLLSRANALVPGGDTSSSKCIDSR